MVDTTIGVSFELREKLSELKKDEDESYENVIWRLIEEHE